MTLHIPANSVEDFMGKKHHTVRSGKAHAYPLLDQINLAHPLVEVAEVTNRTEEL